MTNALYLRADLTLRKRRSLESSPIAKGVPITTTATFSTSEPIQAGNALSLYSTEPEQCPPPHDSDACVAESLRNLTDNIYTHHHHRASLYDKIDERFYSYDHRQLIHLAPESWHQPIITRYSGEVATRVYACNLQSLGFVACILWTPYSCALCGLEREALYE